MHTLENQPPPPADNPFTPFFLAHKHEGSTYQPTFRAFLKEHPELKVLVETGSGCSTVYATMAMEERGGEGHIYSVDPKPWCGYDVQHERVTNIRAQSVHALVDLYAKTGPWDLFLHDGNHDLFAQSYDIAIGFACLRAGGWMWCDDYTWGEHHAWKRFAAEHHLTLVDFGAASAIQKPKDIAAMDASLLEGFSAYSIAKFKLEAHRWRESGHPDTPVFDANLPKEQQGQIDGGSYDIGAL